MKVGSLMYVDGEGKQQIAQPHDPMFSTVTMLATHYWKEDRWKPIYEDAQSIAQGEQDVQYQER
jgi:hypothetical protein